MKIATRLTCSLFLTCAALLALPCTGATDQANSPGECSDAWTATSTMNAPSARVSHTAVWTGSEMIVWGGATGNAFLNIGARYNPSTDTWTPTSTTNAPKGRGSATAVWTGTEMIVWGGSDGTSALNTGGRYNPSTDTWTPTSLVNAPSARTSHTAVWTGSEMIVWGGMEDMTGGRYNPVTDTWTPISTTNAPEGRISHTAVWTGNEMIIWGGFSFTGFNNYLNTGGKYNPATDSWTATSVTNAPAARWHHTAVWTGSEMVIWGGEQSSSYFNAGARYNLGTDSWTATTVTNAPTARKRHTAVWTGSEMIVWGGGQIFTVNTGGRYNPGTDSWTPTSTTDAPLSREDHTAVWTGSQMIVWGGWTGNSRPTDRSGGRYCGAETATSVNGSGSIDGQGDQATFNLHADLTGGRPSGSMTFNDVAAGIAISRAKVRTLTFSGNTAALGGNARLGDGSKVTYSVSVTDNGDGSTDTLNISLSNGYSASGTLTSGDISIQ